MGSIIWNSQMTEKTTIRLKQNTYTGRIGAGTPFNANGEIANNATAIGISVHDITSSHKYPLELIVKGCIDEKVRKQSSGIDLTDECRNALCDIEFVNFDGSASLGGSGGGGASVQSDWNQTDETAADFIKNKPFGDEFAEIMPETVLQDTSGEGVALDSSLFSGDEETLFVSLDGVEYICRATVYADMQGTTLFGNGAFAGGIDSGEPFAIGFVLGMAVIIFVDSEPHSVSISGIVAKKIDPKYNKAFSKIYLSQGNTGDTKYLCSDLMGSMPISQADLIEAAKLPIVVSLGDGTFFSPIFVAPYVGGDYGYIAIQTASDTEVYFTAEYTP